ncbi:MAG: 6-bladed beta-propeller [Balneola sp.]|nr:6-bladed beta-propeller [Balneola sp.]
MKLSVFITTLFLFWCVEIRAQQSIFDVKNYPFTEVASIVLQPDSEIFLPSDLIFHDDKIVVTDKSNKPTIQVFSQENTLLKQKHSLGSVGKGPGEFIDPWDIFIDQQEGYIYIFDAVNRRIAVLNEEYELNENEYVYLKTDGFYTTLNRYKSSFIGSGITTGCMLEIIDANGERIECRGNHPDLGLKSEVSERSVAQRWHSYSVINQHIGKAVFFYRFAKRVAVIDLEGNLINELVDEDLGIPITQVMGGNALPTNIDLRAYISVDANDENIYALYSGEISTGPSSSLGRYIQKFDWDLNLIEVYKLDHLAINVHVDNQGNVYTIEYEPENNIRLLEINLD